MTSEPNEPSAATEAPAVPTAPVAEAPREPAPETVAATPAEPRPETARAVPKSPRAAIEPSEVPPPPKRSKAARSSTVNFLNGIFTVITVIVLGAGAFAWLAKQRFEAKGPLTATTVVVVPPAAGTGAIADLLEKKGVISDGSTFAMAVKLGGQAEKLKAGEYEFEPGISMREVADEITDGRTVQHRITFPEGWSSDQVVHRLLEDQILTGKIAAIPDEGSLLPETYSYSRGSTTREQILDQMKKAMERRVADVWAHRTPGLPLASAKEMVVLASIVEKETGKADERPRVAAVFINRLKKGMRLETDPTVLYGLYGGKAWLEGRTITRTDLASATPYNTYRIAGLPPGPICNPGRAALEAVANPSRTDELFFVADGTGGHVFARTLDEHNRNVQRWRSIEQQPRKPVEGTGVRPLAPSAPTGQNGE